MKRKEVIICVLSIIVLIVSLTDVLATDESTTLPISNLNDLGETTVIQAPTPLQNNNSNNASNIMIDISKDTPTTPITVGNNSNINNVNSNTNIPNTGITDTPIIAVGICIISAVIAYTQIRRYKY